MSVERVWAFPSAETETEVYKLWITTNRMGLKGLRYPCSRFPPSCPTKQDYLVGLVVKSDRPGVRIPLAPGFFRVESCQ